MRCRKSRQVALAAVLNLLVVASAFSGKVFGPPRMVHSNSGLAGSRRSRLSSSGGWKSSAFSGSAGFAQAAPQTWGQAVREADEPRSVCRAVKSKISYERDSTPEDEWRSGSETWNRGSGDCEDIAAAVTELCKERKFDADIYIVSDGHSRKAHAIAIGRWNSGFWLSSNGSYREVSSLDEACVDTARRLGWDEAQASIRLAKRTRERQVAKRK